MGAKGSPAQEKDVFLSVHVQAKCKNKDNEEGDLFQMSLFHD